MPKIRIDEADDLTVAAVMHAKCSTLPATATIGEVRDYFDASGSRRLAFVVEDGRFAGSLTPEHVAGGSDPGRLATTVAQLGPTVSPDAPATTGRDLALQTEARRVAVVDSDGQLKGVVAVTSDLQHFCGTG